MYAVYKVAKLVILAFHVAGLVEATILPAAWQRLPGAAPLFSKAPVGQQVIAASKNNPSTVLDVCPLNRHSSPVTYLAIRPSLTTSPPTTAQAPLATTKASLSRASV